jgi:geranylgeranyl diphosphate synthase type II
MKGYEELRLFFEEALKNQKLNHKPVELYEPIRYTLGLGGKRIRPLLCLMACEMYGKDASEAINQAIAIEYFHNFTLIHDDIMDNAPIRRGHESVYKKWNHNIAILSGDTLFALAYQYAQRVDTKIIHDILCIFNSTAIQVCEGQQYDLIFERDNHVKVDDYLEMIRLKTAVLFGASLKIGAQIGDAPPDDAQNLYDFGVSIGLGFQLRDDLLDTFGDEDVFGKKTGNDILTNKKTYLYLKAMEVADETQRKELIDLYNTTDINPDEKIERVTGIFSALGIKEIVSRIIYSYFEMGMEKLNAIKVENIYKEELSKLALKIIDRKK